MVFGAAGYPVFRSLTFALVNLMDYEILSKLIFPEITSSKKLVKDQLQKLKI